MIAIAVIFVLFLSIFSLFSIEEKTETLDLYGGSTPEEAIALYIQAVEKGDYVLASKFFFEDKQSEEFTKFLSANRHTLERYIERIKQPGLGEYSPDKTLFTLRLQFDGPDFFIRLQKNQFNLWKIIEI